MLSFLMCQWVKIKGIINGKAGKAAALHKFSDTLSLSQYGGSRLCPTIGFALPKIFHDYTPLYFNFPDSTVKLQAEARVTIQ